MRCNSCDRIDGTHEPGCGEPDDGEEICLTGETSGYSGEFYAGVESDGRLHLSGGEYGIILDDKSRKALAALAPVAPTEPELTLVTLGEIAGAMDAVLTGEQGVWVRLEDGIDAEDVVGLEVFVRASE